MRTLHAVLTVIVAALAPLTTTRADEPGKRPAPALKTERVEIPGQNVHFTLVQLPAGRISLPDNGGKQKEIEIKSIWIGQTEVTWDEYDVFWQALDLPERERANAHDGHDRPQIPYEPPDRHWGHDGSPAGSIPCKWARAYCSWLSKKTGKKIPPAHRRRVGICLPRRRRASPPGRGGPQEGRVVRRQFRRPDSPRSQEGA
jgi:formylglycine-generating enzyme required for sulfatase activity